MHVASVCHVPLGTNQLIYKGKRRGPTFGLFRSVIFMFFKLQINKQNSVIKELHISNHMTKKQIKISYGKIQDKSI